MRTEPATHASIARNADRVETLRIHTVVAATDDEARALEESLGELLARLEIGLEARRVERLGLEDAGNGAPLFEPPRAPGATAAPEGATTLAVVWIDLAPATEASVVFSDPTTGRVLLRRRVRKDTSSSVAIEAVAHVTLSAVEEIAEIRRAARAHERVEAPKPPDHERSWGLDVAGFVGGHYFGDGTSLGVGGGAAVGVSDRKSALRPALSLAGSYQSFEAANDAVALAAHVVSARLQPAVRVAGGSTWMVRAGASAGFDAWFASPHVVPGSNALLADARTSVSPILGAAVALHVAVGSTSDLFLSLATDGDLAPYRFVVERGGVHDEVFSAWRVRPSLTLGFSFAATGAAPYPGRGGADAP
jgi:hypothetical protein